MLRAQVHDFVHAHGWPGKKFKINWNMENRKKGENYSKFKETTITGRAFPLGVVKVTLQSLSSSFFVPAVGFLLASLTSVQLLVSPMSRRNLNATPPSLQVVAMQHTLNTEGRTSQLLDEEDHKRCSEGNHRALLAENLDHLRSLGKCILSSFIPKRVENPH